MSATKLPVIKALDAFVFDDPPINEDLVRSLHAGSFLPGRRNIVLIGGTGTGKTDLAAHLSRIELVVLDELGYLPFVASSENLLRSRTTSENPALDL